MFCYAQQQIGPLFEKIFNPAAQGDGHGLSIDQVADMYKYVPVLCLIWPHHNDLALLLVCRSAPVGPNYD
jgi:hypothetical protein